ncbi:NAD(P)(+) transhydrogenase (Re/Si-specific) subunit alpha [Flavipsychrobacter stenotrophus]|uniref:NAD(P) transhydrogenase subunit alpha part 1 n=1 Tax=Flavipsychrobacter stenotrophus TaxID=2077091 RepID=A0A2S7SXW0_9BACT|nr:Re/Si-specific NAD(P)(+) transhydrogenase subunit alpha [Flavipsychrobacter stenotrophus]PQJ11564.1 NAD(P)(+) transhydrogenase (Re/Si-specific) subunit alpha [Flavipsychrobacter stenotrophus]
MIIGVLKEQAPETRVSLVPEVVAAFVKMGVTVWIEQGAGDTSFYGNQLYINAGAEIKSGTDIRATADMVLTIQATNAGEVKPGAVLMGIYQPLFNPEQMLAWAGKGHTVFSLDTIPRTTRAQSMDVLSSQANIAGYKAVLLAAFQYSRYFPMFMTAAGSIPPAKVLILGAGVAGLQAIATARRLGAVVEVFDTRPAVKEEVMSLGAKFVEVEGAADASKAGGYAVEQSEDFQRKQKEKIHEHAKKSDIIITTAQIPGKKAPILITTAMIEDMRAGSLIVDLASVTGGNTELTQNDKAVMYNGVTIIGNSALAATTPADASKLYSKNVLNFAKLIINKEGGINLNFEDDIVKGTCITSEGKIVNERVGALLTVAS